MALPTDRLPNLDEVAAYVGITPRTARRIIRKHGVPVLDTGYTIAFDELALNSFMEALRCRSRSLHDRTVPAVAPKSRGRSSSRTVAGSPSAAARAAIACELSRRKELLRAKNAAMRERCSPKPPNPPATGA